MLEQQTGNVPWEMLLLVHSLNSTDDNSGLNVLSSSVTKTFLQALFANSNGSYASPPEHASSEDFLKEQVKLH